MHLCVHELVAPWSALATPRALSAAAWRVAAALEVRMDMVLRAVYALRAVRAQYVLAVIVKMNTKSMMIQAPISRPSTL
jgi:hypothetical protein